MAACHLPTGPASLCPMQKEGGAFRTHWGGTGSPVAEQSHLMQSLVI